MNSTRFQAVDYGNFDLPDQQTGKESRRFALDQSQDFSLAANYLFINSENFTNPLKIDLSKTLSFRKLYQCLRKALNEFILVQSHDSN